MIEGKKTLNDYRSLLLTNTMSDLVDMFNNNSNNSALVDALLAYTIDTGVFRTGNEKVSEQSVGPHNNLQIPFSTLGNVRFTGFIFYFKSLHKVISETLEVDLSTYNDGLLHLLYLKPDKTFEVTSTKYTGSEDYLLVARFVISTSAVKQFYIITRNAGTNPFDKSGVTYEVIKGLIPKAKSGLTITASDGTIKYSGINILSETDTDILKDTFNNEAIPLRYVTADNTVKWTSNVSTGIITNKIADYINKQIVDVTDGKYICQKAFYDYSTKSFIIQYGTIVYDSYNEALAGASNFNYNEPDFEGIYIPVAVFVIKAGVTDLTLEGNFHVISITDNSSLSAATAVDPIAQKLANNALAAAQAAQSTADSGVSKADAAQTDATKALADAKNAQTDATKANSDLSTHLKDVNNPHNVTKSQIGLANVDNTKDASKPLSTPQKEYVDGKVEDLTKEIAKKASNDTQTKTVVKSTTPTASDYGRALIKGDIWIIP